MLLRYYNSREPIARSAWVIFVRLVGGMGGGVEGGPDSVAVTLAQQTNRRDSRALAGRRWKRNETMMLPE